MIRFVIAFDDQVADLGEYFSRCKTDIVGFLHEQENIVYEEIHEMPAALCNEAYVDVSMQHYNPDPFVFIAYSHGINNALRCAGNSYVLKGSNSNRFISTLFYTNACLTAVELGQDLIDNGCHTYIGYDEEIEAFTADRYMQTSIQCDNAGLKYFFAKNGTIGEAVTAMKQYYTQNIDKLSDFKDMMYAGFLTAAREALVIKGNTNLKKEDLYYQAT